MPKMKMPPVVLAALTLGPALAIGMTLWFVNDLLPECVVNEQQRITAPDQQFDLVVFSRECGPTPANTQAALVPPGEPVPFDAASFFSIPAAADLAARWNDQGQIELDVPDDVDALRQDDVVAGVTVIYR
jgi:hypothetical protein